MYLRLSSVLAILAFSISAYAQNEPYSPKFPAEGPWLLVGYDGICHSLKDEFGAATPDDFYAHMKQKGEDATLKKFDENNFTILDNTQKSFPTLYIVRGLAFCQHLANELKHESSTP